MIYFVKHGEIDRKKWDSCILNSKQRLVYALSWYLDMVAPEWNALVEDDYKAIMPLPIKRKYGINYLYQPYFTQQLGVFSNFYMDGDKLQEFINAIPDDVKYIDYNFNYLNDLSQSKLSIRKRVNYELKLNQSYEILQKSFSDNTRRNIHKTIAGVEIREDIRVQDLISLKRNNTAVNHLASYYEWMNCFIDKMLKINKGFIVGAYLGDELVGAAFFVFCGGKIYYLIPVSSFVGKKKRAMFSILDHVIGKYADTGLILDFEGSTITGIARFFAGFGAKPVYYSRVKINNLPFPYRMFKN